MIRRRSVRPLAAVLSAATALAGVALPASAQGEAADVCLEISAAAVTEAAWSALGEGVAAAISSHPSLFPAPTVAAEGWRLDVWAGHGDPMSEAGASCLEPGYEWTARFSRGFLEAGADRLLAEAPTTPGIDSDVSLEWDPAEGRVRTVLVFAGPFEIPNGSCWVDDALAVDRARGIAVASAAEGRRTSPFAEWACDRFFDHLPDGGAGEQAVTLLPTTIELADGAALRLVAREVLVRDDAIVIAGSIEDA